MFQKQFKIKVIKELDVLHVVKNGRSKKVRSRKKTSFLITNFVKYIAQVYHETIKIES